MNIHVIGSGGFLGKELKEANGSHELICWSHCSTTHYFNLFDSSSWNNLLQSCPESVMLLSWPGLPEYNKDFHLTHNLPCAVKLVRSLLSSGCKNLLVAGTCYEYGMACGALSELIPPDPINSYAIAKDCLRRYVQTLCSANKIRWIWPRIFYPYGTHQNPNSLYPSLLKAINDSAESFALTSGNQTRDFISARALSEMLLNLISSDVPSGIYNCGSGVPLTVYDFAQSIVSNHSGVLRIESKLNQLREYEPKYFWADMKKYKLEFNYEVD